mmetsp:Transcript_19962/g.29449  ORF Transcript_19962/g.29449 Transcript_19962/m.29449 type:complete len:98 (-) Transcript_19962:199-492(-)
MHSTHVPWEHEHAVSQQAARTMNHGVLLDKKRKKQTDSIVHWPFHMSNLVVVDYVSLVKVPGFFLSFIICSSFSSKMGTITTRHFEYLCRPAFKTCW